MEKTKMRKTMMLLAGAAGLAIAAGAAHAQTIQSWGNSTTTYFYSPSTSDSYTPGGAPSAAIPSNEFPAPFVEQNPSFYRAPDSYGVNQQTPGYNGTISYDRPYYYMNEGDNLGQGSGHSGYMLGR